jgi:hypothetical protein
MRRALLASLLALTALPATAAAQAQLPDPETLLEGPVAERAPVRIARGGELDFAVRSPTAPGSVTIRISGTSQTDDLGRLHGPDGTWVDNPAAPGGQPGLHEWHADAGFLARRRPGSYWWQVIVDPNPADPAQQPQVGAVERFEVLQPAANRSQRKLHPSFGRRGSGSFYLSNAAFPAGVSGSRFRALARRAGARWGLEARRWTSARAGRRDGYNIAGFSASVPRHALAMQVDYVVGSRRNVVERDLALRPDLPWKGGPGYPALDQFDLESVLLHELSHFAGNKRHTPRCANSPLVVGLAAGEWWRGPSDSWMFGCDAAAATASRSFTGARSTGVVVHRTIRVG